MFPLYLLSLPSRLLGSWCRHLLDRECQFRVRDSLGSEIVAGTSPIPQLPFVYLPAHLLQGSPPVFFLTLTAQPLKAIHPSIHPLLRFFPKSKSANTPIGAPIVISPSILLRWILSFFILASATLVTTSFSRLPPPTTPPHILSSSPLPPKRRHPSSSNITTTLLQLSMLRRCYLPICAPHLHYE